MRLRGLPRLIVEGLEQKINDSRKSFVRFFFVLLNMVVGEVFLVGEIYLNLVRG